MEIEHQGQPDADLSEGDNRRGFLRKAAIGAGAAWVAPQIISAIGSAAAAGSCTPIPSVGGSIALSTPAGAGTNLNGATTGGNRNSDTNMLLIRERKGFTFPGPTWTPDVGVPITAGTSVASYILHHSPATSAGAGATLTGTISFTGALILGYDYKNTGGAGSRTSLDLTDPIFGNPATVYQTGVVSRRTMDGEPTDLITNSGGAGPFTSVTVKSVTLFGPIDQVRFYILACP